MSKLVLKSLCVVYLMVARWNVRSNSSVIRPFAPRVLRESKKLLVLLLPIPDHRIRCGPRKSITPLNGRSLQEGIGPHQQHENEFALFLPTSSLYLSAFLDRGLTPTYTTEYSSTSDKDLGFETTGTRSRHLDITFRCSPPISLNKTFH